MTHLSMARCALVSVTVALLFAAGIEPVSAQTAEDQSLIEAAQREKVVNWYTAENTDAAESIAAHFSQRYPGITVKINRSGAERLGGQFLQENDANIHNADVLTVYDMSILEDLKEKNLLAKYAAPNAAHVDPRFKDPDNTYVVTTADAYVIGFNTKYVPPAEAPADWPDLLAPKWKGRVTLNSPLFSGMAVYGAAGISSKFGWSFYESLKASNPLIVQSITDTILPVISGERWICITSAQLVRQMARKGDPVAFVIPKSGAVFLAGATGIAASAPHPSAGRLFEEFYLSKELQTVLGEFGFYPVRSDMAVPQGETPLAKLPLIIIDPRKLAGEKAPIKANFKKIFGG